MLNITNSGLAVSMYELTLIEQKMSGMDVVLPELRKYVPVIKKKKNKKKWKKKNKKYVVSDILTKHSNTTKDIVDKVNKRMDEQKDDGRTSYCG